MSWSVASDIGDRIKDLRHLLGHRPDSALSQEELGIRAGVRPSQVSQWERGVQQPSRSRLERWAEREGWPITIFAEGSAMPSEVLAATVNGSPLGQAFGEKEGAGAPTAAPTDSADSHREVSPDPDQLLARFYQLMAKAAEQGSPWSAEAAEIVHGLHHIAKRSSAPPGPPGRADPSQHPQRDPSDEVPDW